MATTAEYLYTYQLNNNDGIYSVSFLLDQELVVTFDQPLLPFTGVDVAREFDPTPIFPDPIYLGYTESGGMLIRTADGRDIFLTDLEYDFGQEVSFTFDEFPYCLLAGTLVLTATGERPVEDIRIGDLVLTADGDTVPVRWVGRQSLITMFNHRALPIVIRVGALGDNVPSRDLHVSPDHAILLDDYLVQAQALVNGTTITVMDTPPAQLDYYHLELDTQRIIIADGTPVESFVDDATRAGFDNYPEWVALGLAPQPADTLPHPRVKSTRQLPAQVRARLREGKLADV
jgi:hypothetical protein